MAKLKVLQPYRNQALNLLPGSIIDVSDELAQWLMKDSPECFEYYIKAPKAADIPNPPSDKMMRAPVRKKTGVGKT